MHTLSFTTILGALTLKESDGCISELSFKKEESVTPTPLLQKCAREITEYLEGRRKTFSVPLAVNGTAFDKKVRTAIQATTFGKTVTYGEIAKKIGSPKAYRAVANACGRNPLPLVIPCHRVVGSNGLGGYNGGVALKKLLLAREQTKKHFSIRAL